MKILRSDLDLASQQGIISAEQAKNLWAFLENVRPHQAKFQMLDVIYYFGGFLVLASMSWLLTEAWSSGAAVMAISGFFGLIFILVGRRLWEKRAMQIPGGLLITAAVGMAPIFIYGLQKVLGLWPQGDPAASENFYLWVKGSWFFVEIGTIVAAIFALRAFPFTFITFPIAISLWFLSIDLTSLIFGKNNWGWDQRMLVSCVFGLLVLLASYFVDRKYKKVDFAFWTYLYGMLAFWFGLVMIIGNSEMNQHLFGILNIGFIFLSVYLRRKVFIIFGSVGVIGYLSSLAWRVFADSFAFALVIALLGILLVYLGVKYQKNKEKFEAAIKQQLPHFLTKWRPEERA